MIKRVLILFGLAATIASCGNDDNGVVTVPPRLLAEVAPENDEDIQEYLETHFYNYEDFQNPPVDFDFRIRLDTIAGTNSDKIPLSQQVTVGTVNVSSSEFLLEEEEEEIPHNYYYLIAREGIGVFPSEADSTFVRYQGLTLDGTVFDGSTETPLWFDLARIQAPLEGFRGFSVGLKHFRTGGAPIVNPDGTFSVEDYGVGLIIFPSGLGSFNNFAGGVPQYAPLIFTVDLFTFNQADHDGDGIPSILEDLNGNGYLYDDNTDEEEEANTLRFSNFLDADDDGDGIDTRDEIDFDAEGNPVFRDTDGDGIFDHLDPDTA